MRIYMEYMHTSSVHSTRSFLHRGKRTARDNDMEISPLGRTQGTRGGAARGRGEGGEEVGD